MSVTTNPSPTVLAVDDDDLILSSLRELFLSETNYQFLAFSDPHEALKELELRPVDLVISALLIPSMNGVDFLCRVRTMHPGAVRILLADFADKETAIRAINEVGVFQYLEKPWDNGHLLRVVRNALGEKSLRRQLSEKVEELSRLVQEHKVLSTHQHSLDRELEMAARVQKSLFPEFIPEIEGYRFATFYESCASLGGDYYDFVQRSDCTVILLSDASGHGLQAALTTTLIKAIFHEAAGESQGPEQLLNEMSSRLHRFLPSGTYACAATVWISAGTSNVRVTNAGLPHPFLLSGKRMRTDEIPVDGLPLGLFGQVMSNAYDSRELQLDQGDVLLLVSDGLGDIRGSDDQFFGDNRLKQALSELRGCDGRLMISSLVEQARDFGGGSTCPDDVAMVAITKV